LISSFYWKGFVLAVNPPRKSCDPFAPYRYERNAGCITAEQQAFIQTSTVAIVGFGGLGQRVAELILRAGVRHLILIDFDTVDASNLNRQLISTEANVGTSKLAAGVELFAAIDSCAVIETYQDKLENLDPQIFATCTCIVDALDNPQTRLALADIAEANHLPLIHGAIADWTGRVGVFTHNYDMYRFLCQDSEQAQKAHIANLGPVAATCAALQATEVFKVLMSIANKSDATQNISAANDVNSAAQNRSASDSTNNDVKKGTSTDVPDKLIEFDLLNSSFQTIPLG